MDLGLLVLRALIGGLFFVRGGQRRFGWFGGAGLEPAARHYTSLGYDDGMRTARFVGTAEVVAGALLLIGFLTAIASTLIAAAMLMAAASYGMTRRGPWVGNGGFEYPLVVAVVALALGATGPGALSLAALTGVWLSGWVFFFVAAGAGILLGMVLLPRPLRAQVIEPFLDEGDVVPRRTNRAA